MAKINVLTRDIYNFISAGEIVVEPASLVKELIENSIDAEATKISIEIVNGGKSQIIVRDNGVGIEKSEVEKAFLKHATSKIATKEDIYKIQTMGFRGEALHSIALVSSVVMTTRSKEEETGTRIEVEGGVILFKEEVSAEVGTIIDVTKLFYNTPARYKFLSTATKEYKEIHSLVSNFILAHPNIEFELIVDGVLKVHNVHGSLESAIFSIFGSEFASNMIKINEKFGEYRLEGAIGNPTISKSNHSWQKLFVNSRLVQSREIESAVNAVYSNYLMKSRFPCFVLNLLVPYDEVDVNVSPQKTEVKLSNGINICNWIVSCFGDILADVATQEELEDLEIERMKKANEELRPNNGYSIKNILQDKEEYFNKIYASNEDKKPVQQSIKSSVPAEIREFQMQSEEDEEIENANKLNSATAISTRLYDQLEELKQDAIFRAEALSELEGEDDEEENCKFQNFNVNENLLNQNNAINSKNISHLYFQGSFVNVRNKIVGVLFNTYIVVENDEEFFIIDQHAVHEKFLFDKFMTEIENSAVVTQELMIPFKFEASLNEKNFVLENSEALKALGIEIQDFGQNSLLITTVPLILADVSLNTFVSELLTDLTIFSKDKIALKNKIATKACKNAVKAGDQLTESEIEKILEMVETSKTPLLCPHGRPYVVKITKSQVEKWFKRTL